MISCKRILVHWLLGSARCIRTCCLPADNVLKHSPTHLFVLCSVVKIPATFLSLLHPLRRRDTCDLSFIAASFASSQHLRPFIAASFASSQHLRPFFHFYLLCILPCSILRYNGGVCPQCGTHLDTHNHLHNVSWNETCSRYSTCEKHLDALEGPGSTGNSLCPNKLMYSC